MYQTHQWITKLKAVMYMKHSAQIVTFLSALRLAYGSMPLEPAETRPRSNSPESRNAFSKFTIG